jgi:porphobilinogen synthase
MTLLTEPITAAAGAFRGRRLRRTASLRALVRETRLHPSMLMQPLFVRPGTGVREPIASMPGQHRLSVDELAREADRLLQAGVTSVLLFGLPDTKDAEGSGAWTDDGIVQRAIAELRRSGGEELAIVADVCLCEYTSHGHCGVIRDASVDNDATLPLLARTAVSLANAGADVVAPSAMMDAQVAAIRAALDREGLAQTAILAYAAKHASAFYGPFREAAD